MFFLLVTSPATPRLAVGDACGVPASTGGLHEGVRIAADSTGLYLGWSGSHPFSPQGADVSAQHVTPTGSAAWGSYGVVVSNAAQDQDGVHVAPDGSGGSLLAWNDHSSAGPLSVYVQRLDASGTPLWTPNGVLVAHSAAINLSWSSQLIPDGEGGGIIAFYQDSSGTYVVRVQRFGPAGTPQWGAEGTRIGTGYTEALVPDAEGGAYVCFNSGSPNDAYVQRVDRDGAVQWPMGGILLAESNRYQVNVRGIADGQGGAIFGWNDELIFQDVFAQRVSPAGAILWSSTGRLVASLSGVEDIVTDGGGGAIVTFYPRNSSPHMQHIDAAGNLTWNPPSGMSVPGGAMNVAEDGLGGLYAMWTDASGATRRIVAQRYSPAGNELWAAGGIPLCEDPNIDHPVVTADGSSGVYGAWSVSGTDASNRTLVVTRLKPDGAPKWTAGVIDRPGELLGLSLSPNPARRSVEIRFRLPEATRYTLAIHDLAGRRVFEMREALATAAAQSVRWDRRDRLGREVPPGVYLVALRAGAASATRHCLVLR